MTAATTEDAIIAALGLVNGEVPVLIAAYQALKTIWTAANPAMTEEDYKTRLRQVSADGAAFTADWLTSHGYVQDAAGNWSKPTPTTTASTTTPPVAGAG